MRQWIARCQRRQRQRRAHGLLQPPRIAKCPNQPMVCFNMAGIRRNRSAKCLSSLSRRPRGEQIDPALAELFGSGNVGLSHGFL